CVASYATDTTEICTLSLHDALPISDVAGGAGLHRREVRGRARPRVLTARHPLPGKTLPRPMRRSRGAPAIPGGAGAEAGTSSDRSEEHTSELQSRENLVCRLLLEKK